MKNSVLCGLVIFILLSNVLFAQNETKMLFNPILEEETNEWIKITNNDTNYNIKLYCFYGVPYKGEVYVDTLLPQTNEVNYWSKDYLIQIVSELNEGIPLKFLLDIEIGDNVVSFKEANEISMYIVDALTGDTAVMYNFPKPETSISVFPICNSGDEVVERLNRQLYAGRTDAAGNLIMESANEIATYNYALPEGVYFAYFINTDDGKLRWIEKIIK